MVRENGPTVLLLRLVSFTSNGTASPTLQSAITSQSHGFPLTTTSADREWERERERERGVQRKAWEKLEQSSLLKHGVDMLYSCNTKLFSFYWKLNRNEKSFRNHHKHKLLFFSTVHLQHPVTPQKSTVQTLYSILLIFNIIQTLPLNGS